MIPSCTTKRTRGASVAQLSGCLRSGRDPRVLGWGLPQLPAQRGVCFSLCPSPLHALFLSQINNLKTTTTKKRTEEKAVLFEKMQEKGEKKKKKNTKTPAASGWWAPLLLTSALPSSRLRLFHSPPLNKYRTTPPAWVTWDLILSNAKPNKNLITKLVKLKFWKVSWGSYSHPRNQLNPWLGFCFGKHPV